MTDSPVWITASYGEPAETTPMELAELGLHKRQCMASSRRLVALQCGVSRLHGLVSARLVTSLALLAALAALGLLLVL